MKPTRVYWDSCVFIDLFKKTPGRIDVLKDIAFWAEAGQIEIITSTISFNEVFRIDDLPKDATGRSMYYPVPKKHMNIITEYMRNVFILPYEVTRGIAELARQYQWDHNLRAMDAIHVATATMAIKDGVEALQTYDGENGGADGLIGRMNGKIPDLKICVPYVPDAIKLVKTQDEIKGAGTEQTHLFSGPSEANDAPKTNQ